MGYKLHCLTRCVGKLFWRDTDVCPSIGQVVFLFGDIKAKIYILTNLEYLVRNETRQYKNRFYVLNVECKL
jgi:hypothetical protein